MKNLSLWITLMLFSVLVYAQPSDATMLAKVKTKHTNLISAKLEGSGISERVYENSAWKYTYRKSYTVKTRTKHQGITHVYSGGIQYRKAGSGYVYDQLLVGDGHYEGVPNPDKAEIMKMIDADLENFLKNHHYNSIVGKISEITFADNPEWHWHKLTSVSFKMKVTYTESISYTKMETAEHTYEVRLYSDEFKAPWTKFLSSEKQNEKKVIEIKEYTADEVRAMKTLADIDRDNKVKRELAELPEIPEIPNFESDKQLFYFLHNKIMTSDTKTVEAYLYKLMGKNCYMENSNLILTQWTGRWYKTLIDGHEAYKVAYCDYPAVQHYQAGQIVFYDKENRRQLRFVGSYEDGTWKLQEIGFYAAKKDEQERMKTMTQNCGEKPNLTVRKIIAYNIGDKVNAKFSNGTFPAYITKKDPNMSDRYFIKLDGDNSGKGYWMKEQFFTPRSAESSTTTSSNNNNSNSNANNSNNNQKQSFKVGDKVKVKTTKGWMKATVIKTASGQFLVKFKLPAFENMWVKANQLKMQ